MVSEDKCNRPATKLLDRMLFKKLRLTSPLLPLRLPWSGGMSKTVSYVWEISAVEGNMGQRRNRLRLGCSFSYNKSSWDPLRLRARSGFARRVCDLVRGLLPALAGGRLGADDEKAAQGRGARGGGDMHVRGRWVRERWCTVDGPHVLPFTPSAGTGNLNIAN